MGNPSVLSSYRAVRRSSDCYASTAEMTALSFLGHRPYTQLLFGAKVFVAALQHPEFTGASEFKSLFFFQIFRLLRLFAGYFSAPNALIQCEKV
ncbi:hypothetical protein [Permianibacter aggregans]|uniref:hypothetical protein n=1 Tax=Permianibacter aggregans TaxID=1510150 RepID=UPI00105C13D6|nr:hypothetical protein [Permianibacter aggregans]QGX40219.1 hypothetical protein E2H98_11270 [Permianibacter aggregans]